jgi:hypothetical protein
MPRFRFELEQQEVQTTLSLMGVGFNNLVTRITDQLKAGPLPEEPQPRANGADQPEQRPVS